MPGDPARSARIEGRAFAAAAALAAAAAGACELHFSASSLGPEGFDASFGDSGRDAAVEPIPDAAALDAGSDAGGAADAACTSPGCRVPDHLVLVGGDGQQGAPGLTLLEPLRVRVVDAAGQPVSGVTVDFRFLAGTGSLTDSRPSSDGEGIARCWMTLGYEAGARTARAEVPSMPGTPTFIDFVASPGGPAFIHRSVGASDPLASGSAIATLLVGGDTAMFALPLPASVGVGDALAYASSGGAIDSIAFIAGRWSASVYVLRSAAGGAPVPTQGVTSNWILHRAYADLYDAINLQPNPTIPAAVRGYDTFAMARDLVALGARWRIACYADRIDPFPVEVYGWTTARGNDLRIYTPTEPHEAGASQRHRGRWGSGYQRTDILGVTGTDHLTIEGISAQTPGTGVLVRQLADGAEVGVFGCYLETPGAATTDSPLTVGMGQGGAYAVKLANNIVVTRCTLRQGQPIWIEVDSTASVYAYANTTIALAGADSLFVSRGAVHVKNHLATCTGAGVCFSGPFATLESSASSDGTAALNGDPRARTSASFSFRDDSAGDFHLSGDDTGARGGGQDLSADPALPLSHDVDGERRSGVWDIGADQLP